MISISRAEDSSSTGTQSLWSRARARPIPFWAVLALVVVLGLALAAPTLRLGLVVDEPYTADTAHLSWTAMWAQLYRDSPDPLIYVLLNLWTRVAGEGALALRAPSLVFFALTIWVTGQLARQLGGAWAGVVAALLVAVSNIGVTFAARARPYELLALCAVVSAYLGCTLLELFGPARHRLLLAVALAGVYVVSVLTHPVFVFYALGLTLAGLWCSPRQLAWLAGAGAAAAAVYLLLMLPVLRVVLPLPTTAWLQPPHWRDVLAGLTQLWSELSAGLLVLALVILLVARIGRVRSLLRQPPTRVFLTLLIVTCVSLLAVSRWVKPIYFAPRTSILWLPATSVLVALLLAGLDHARWITRLALAAIIGQAVAAMAPVWANPAQDPAQAIIAAIAPDLRCADRIVAGGLAYDEVAYYLRQDGFGGCLEISTFPANTILHPGWLDLPRSDILAAEAAQVAASLKAEPDVPVWFFYSGIAQPSNDALKAELDRSLGQPQERVRASSSVWINRVYVYLPRSQTGSTNLPARLTTTNPLAHS